ncbi:unnamed protein product [Pedinophyceae sp. YPF-701]|nr:unnamed protein product [Pedinophyceae sp. YPF-701]
MAGGRAPTDTKIANACKKILPTVDINVTSERDVRLLVAGSLQCPELTQDESFKAVVRREIGAYIEAAGVDATGVEPAAKRKGEAGPSDNAGASRKRAAAPAAKGTPKKAKGGAKGDVEIALSDMRKASISTWKQTRSVDVREFYEKDGKKLPGFKGVRLSREQWVALVGMMPQATAALEAEDGGFNRDLAGSNKRVSIYVGKIKAVDVREYWEKDGEWKPGKKGIALPADQWAKLCGAADALTVALGPPPAQDAAATGSPAPGGSQADEFYVDLANKKRCTVSYYKGKLYVGLREFYQGADGVARPSSKGISLSPEQWAALSPQLESLQQALHNRDTSASVQLSDTRRAVVSEFKGAFFLNVREFWVKKGTEELLPGKKGVALNGEGVAALVINRERIDEKVREMEAEGDPAEAGAADEKDKHALR